MGKHKKDVIVPANRTHWEHGPEWQRVADRVYTAEEKGLTQEQIVTKLKLDKHLVKRIIEDDALRDKRARRAFSRKIPDIQDIISSSLSILKEELVKISENPEYRELMIRGMKDLVSLKTVITDLNMLARLELGESTQNVAIQTNHTYQETREVIQELKRKDPIFDYPELPEPPKDFDG